MADDFTNRLIGLLGNPGFAGGVGLLAGALSPQTTTVGQAIAGANRLQQGASNAQLATLKNDAVRSSLLDEQRRRAALARLTEMAGDPLPDFSGDPIVPSTGLPFGQRAITEGRTREMLGLLATVAPDTFAEGLLSRMLPAPVAPLKPTNLEREFNFLMSIGIPRDRAIEALQKGTTVNVGTADKPLSPTDALKVRVDLDGDGIPESTPPPGTTMGQLPGMGAVFLDDADQKRVDQVATLQTQFSNLVQLAVGPEGIFSEIEPGIYNMTVTAAETAFNRLFEGDPRVRNYESARDTLLRFFASFAGEGKVLSDADIARLENAFPDLSGVPDTRVVAEQKLARVRQIIRDFSTRLGIHTEEGQEPAGESPAPSAGTGKEFDYDPATGRLIPR